MDFNKEIIKTSHFKKNYLFIRLILFYFLPLIRCQLILEVLHGQGKPGLRIVRFKAHGQEVRVVIFTSPGLADVNDCLVLLELDQVELVFSSVFNPECISVRVSLTENEITYKASIICLGLILIPGILMLLPSPSLKLLSGMHIAYAMFLTTVLVRLHQKGILSKAGSSMDSAIGQMASMP